MGRSSSGFSDSSTSDDDLSATPTNKLTLTLPPVDACAPASDVSPLTPMIMTSPSNAEVDLERGVIVLGCTTHDDAPKPSCWAVHGARVAAAAPVARRAATAAGDDWAATAAVARAYAHKTGRTTCALGLSYALSEEEADGLWAVADEAIERARFNFVKKAFVRVSPGHHD